MINGSMYALLRRQSWLAFRRSPAFEQGVAARVWMGISAFFGVCYLIFLGAMAGIWVSDKNHPGAIVMIMGAVMIADFVLRFMFVQSPSMLFKPYALLPLRRKTIADAFLLRLIFSIYNAIWLSAVLPFVVLALVGGCPVLPVVAVAFTLLLMIVMSGQWFWMVCSLATLSVFWWLLPVAVAGGYIALMVWAYGSASWMNAFDSVLTWSAEHGLLILLTAAVVAALFLINRRLQLRIASQEMGREAKHSGELKKVSRFAFLNRYGMVGEYLKLELKSIMRNRVVRLQARSALIATVVISLLIAYTDMVENMGTSQFWCFYCFIIYSESTLSYIMCHEGNYIDLLFTTRESILKLLHAKYYLHLALLLLPFIVLIPLVVTGKFPLLLVISYMTTAGGLVLMMLFQLAVYNKQTFPLEIKITGKKPSQSGWQIAITMISMLAPVGIISLLSVLPNPTAAYWCVIVFNLALVAAHPLWLRNIYNRMMKRRYENLEGFIQTR